MSNIPSKDEIESSLEGGFLSIIQKGSEYTEFQWESTEKSSKITNNGMTAIAI